MEQKWNLLNSNILMRFFLRKVIRDLQCPTVRSEAAFYFALNVDVPRHPSQILFVDADNFG